MRRYILRHSASSIRLPDAVRGPPVANHQKRDVVGWVCASPKSFDGLENCTLYHTQWRVGMLRKSIPQPLRTEKVLMIVFRLRNPVGVKEQRVPRFKPNTVRIEGRLFQKTNREGSSGIEFAHLSAPHQQRRRMAGAHVLEISLRIEQAEKHRRVAANHRVLAEKAVQVVENLHRLHP